MTKRKEVMYWHWKNVNSIRSPFPIRLVQVDGDRRQQNMRDKQKVSRHGKQVVLLTSPLGSLVGPTGGHAAAGQRRQSCGNGSLDSTPGVDVFRAFRWVEAGGLHELTPGGSTWRPCASGETDPGQQIESNLGQQAHFHQRFPWLFESSGAGVVPSPASTFQILLLHLNATSLVTLSSFFCGWQHRVVF